MARKAWLVPMSIDQLEEYKTALYCEIASVVAEVELKKSLADLEDVDLEPSAQLRLPWSTSD